METIIVALFVVGLDIIKRKIVLAVKLKGRNEIKSFLPFLYGQFTNHTFLRSYDIPNILEDAIHLPCLLKYRTINAYFSISAFSVIADLSFDIVSSSNLGVLS